MHPQSNGTGMARSSRPRALRLRIKRRSKSIKSNEIQGEFLAFFILSARAPMFPDLPESTQNIPPLYTDLKLSYRASAPGTSSRPNFAPTLSDFPFPPSGVKGRWQHAKRLKFYCALSNYSYMNCIQRDVVRRIFHMNCISCGCSKVLGLWCSVFLAFVHVGQTNF